LVDVRLYLPKEWANDRKRGKQAGVPKEQRRHRTRHDLALEMVRQDGPKSPPTWVAGADERGRSSTSRKSLRQQHERYLLAVPSNTALRDLQAVPPPYSGRGPRPKVPFVQARHWAAGVAEGTWKSIEVRAGAKGPLVVQVVATRVQARTDTRAVGPEELLVVIRAPPEDGSWE
jgi:hypothetical protein